MRTGAPLPDSPEFLYDAFGRLVRDADGNVLGGVRLAPIDVPVAGYNGHDCETDPDGPGSTAPFTDLDLFSRYPTHADYMARLREAIEDDVAHGFLMPEDGDDLLERAAAAAHRLLLQ